jgi:hypothetical protein
MKALAPAVECCLAKAGMTGSVGRGEVSGLADVGAEPRELIEGRAGVAVSASWEHELRARQHSALVTAAPIARRMAGSLRATRCPQGRGWRRARTLLVAILWKSCYQWGIRGSTDTRRADGLAQSSGRVRRTTAASVGSPGWRTSGLQNRFAQFDDCPLRGGGRRRRAGGAGQTGYPTSPHRQKRAQAAARHPGHARRAQPAPPLTCADGERCPTRSGRHCLRSALYVRYP